MKVRGKEARLYATYTSIAKKRFRGNVLDIGCGSQKAFVSFLSGTVGYQACGFDKNKCDLEKDIFPYPDRSFSVVTANGVIEHIQNYYNLFSEVNRVLKSGGIFIARTPNYDMCPVHFWDNADHKKPYTPETIVCASNNWFETIYCEPGLICKSSIYNKLPFKYWIASKIRGGTSSFIWVGEKIKNYNKLKVSEMWKEKVA